MEGDRGREPGRIGGARETGVGSRERMERGDGSCFKRRLGSASEMQNQ